MITVVKITMEAHRIFFLRVYFSHFFILSLLYIFYNFIIQIYSRLLWHNQTIHLPQREKQNQTLPSCYASLQTTHETCWLFWSPPTLSSLNLFLFWSNTFWKPLLLKQLMAYDFLSLRVPWSLKFRLYINPSMLDVIPSFLL